MHELKRHHYCLENLNETSYKVWKCMDQQHSALVKHVIRCFSCLPLFLTCPQPNLSLINHLINDRLLDAWTTIIRCRFNSPTSCRPASIALLRFCNLRTKVWNVRKSPAGCYMKSGVRDKAARQLCMHGALATVLLKLMLVPFWLYKEYGIYRW